MQQLVVGFKPNHGSIALVSLLGKQNDSAAARHFGPQKHSWAIENALHWQLDVTFREDAARNRKDNGPANIAVLRRRALDIARRDTSKCSLTIKLKRAGWDDDFLLSLLRQLQVP